MNHLTSGERLYRLCDPVPTLELQTKVDVISKMRQKAGTMWTPELDVMLVEDIQCLVSGLSQFAKSSDVLIFCTLALKYHCTPADIQERMEVIYARALKEVEDKWLSFQKTRFGEIRYPVNRTGSGALQSKKQHGAALMH